MADHAEVASLTEDILRVRVADPIVDTSSGSSLPKSIVGAQLPLSPENSMTLSTDYTFRPSFGPLTLTANHSSRPLRRAACPTRPKCLSYATP